MSIESYPPGLAALAIAHYQLQADRRLGICREDLLNYIDRHRRRASPEPEFNRYACTTWNGGAANSTRKVFKFLMRLFRVNPEGKFTNLRKRQIDEAGFVKLFREEIQKATGLGSTAVGTALSRLSELGIVTRKHTRSEVAGHRHAWFRFNPDAIYKVLGMLPGFHVAREEVRAKRQVAVERTAEPVKTEVVGEVENHEDKPKNTASSSTFSSSGPLTEVRQVCSHPGSGGAGVEGQSENREPGAVVVMEGPATPGTRTGNKKATAAPPAEVFQPPKDWILGQPPSRVSQQMLDNASNPRIQAMKAAAQKAGFQLSPSGLAGGQPFLLPIGRQIIYPKLSSEARGFMFIPPPANHPPTTSTYARA